MKRIDYNNGDELAVKVIYGEDFNLPTHLLYAKTEATLDIPKLADSIELIEAYNNFRGKDVADSLRKLHDRGLVGCARFGREHSPVLYVEPPFEISQARGNRILTREEREEMFKEIIEELRKTNPDELSLTKSTELGAEPCELSKPQWVRAWWD